ncbi:hypothetical protein GCM10019016_110770 [Streptomyces prasinosporus]|uniref:Iron ABC transporter permease n=1 Tax=Streptomyces prasinosporus TaxID=68256 RepID=A0ABP6UAL1_9ACTN
MKTNRAVRVPGGLSVRLDVRAFTVVVLLMLLALGASVLLIGTGDFPMSASDVLRSLAGQGTEGQEFIVTELRLPAGPGRVCWSAPPSGSAAPCSSPSPATRWAAPTSSASARARRPARSP